MNRSTKAIVAPIVWGLLMQATNAYAAEKQAWLVESVGFSQAHTADLILQVGNGKYWASAKDMEGLGFDLTKLATVNGLIDLSSGGDIDVDELNQKITVKVKTELLPENNLDMRSGLESMIPGRPASGAFVNYDIRANRDVRTDLTGMFDASTFVTDNVRANVQTLVRGGSIGRLHRTERVSASLIKNDPVSAVTWVAGDAYSAGGQGINPVSFTGFQAKRNFGLQTGFVSQPTYDLRGNAAAPSALDVYIDNRKVMSSYVPAGPFSLKNLVGLEGSSNARIVTRDAFGHEQVLTETLLGGPELLKNGLTSFAVQSGVMRPSNSETDGTFISGYYRHGFTNYLTAEVNAEKSFDGRTLTDVEHIGGAIAVSTPLGNFGWAGRQGTGTMSTISYQGAIRKTTWSANINASKTTATADYTILGTHDGHVQSRRAIQAALQMDNGFGLSMLNVTTGADSNSGVTLNYRQRRAYATNYSLTYNRTKSLFGSDSSVFLAASIPLNFGNSNRTRMLNSRVGEDFGGKITQSSEYYDAPSGLFGTSFKLREEGPQNALRYDTEATHRTPHMEMGVASSSTALSTGYRAHMRGAIVAHEGKLGAMRYVDGGYAVVDAGAPNIKVKVNGQYEGDTNSDGIAYVPVLMPYTRTGISLDPETVPANYDNNTEYLATHIGGGALAVFRGIVASMVSIPGITDGNVVVDDVMYPITDRGVFVELPEGKYTGKTDKGRVVKFEIPKVAITNGLTYVKGTIE
jgi:outer membrane usher protein